MCDINHPGAEINVLLTASIVEFLAAVAVNGEQKARALVFAFLSPRAAQHSFASLTYVMASLTNPGEFI